MTTKAKVYLSSQLGKNKIVIDGKDISAYVRSIEVFHWVGDLPTIKLDLYIPDCEIEIENSMVKISSVEIPQSTKDKIVEKILADNHEYAMRIIHEQD